MQTATQMPVQQRTNPRFANRTKRGFLSAASVVVDNAPIVLGDVGVGSHIVLPESLLQLKKAQTNVDIVALGSEAIALEIERIFNAGLFDESKVKLLINGFASRHFDENIFTSHAERLQAAIQHHSDVSPCKTALQCFSLEDTRKTLMSWISPIICSCEQKGLRVPQDELISTFFHDSDDICVGLVSPDTVHQIIVDLSDLPEPLKIAIGSFVDQRLSKFGMGFEDLFHRNMFYCEFEHDANYSNVCERLHELEAVIFSFDEAPSLSQIEAFSSCFPKKMWKDFVSVFGSYYGFSDLLSDIHDNNAQSCGSEQFEGIGHAMLDVEEAVKVHQYLKGFTKRKLTTWRNINRFLTQHKDQIPSDYENVITTFKTVVQQYEKHHIPTADDYMFTQLKDDCSLAACYITACTDESIDDAFDDAVQNHMHYLWETSEYGVAKVELDNPNFKAAFQNMMLSFYLLTALENALR